MVLRRDRGRNSSEDGRAGRNARPSRSSRSGADSEAKLDLEDQLETGAQPSLGEQFGDSRRREVPVRGSATELKRLRGKSNQELQAMLDNVDTDQIAADILKRKRLFYGILILVSVMLLVYIIAGSLGLKELAYNLRFSVIAAPICFAFGINDLCMYIARGRPDFAIKLLSFLTLGNPQSIRNLAALHIDNGDSEKAEKILSSKVGLIDAKRKMRDYVITYAFLATMRAHVGRMSEAEQLIREVLAAAEGNHAERGTDGSAYLLAETLTYAALLCDQRDKIQDGLSLARRAVSLFCEYNKPPPEATLAALGTAGYLCNVVGEYHEAGLYLTKANEMAAKTGVARDGDAAFVLSNLGIANLGIGRATMCKRFLSEAETKATMPLGFGRRPHVFQCWAIYHFANSRLEESLTAYEAAIDICGRQKPKDSVFLLRIIKEYTVLLREVGKPNEAEKNELRSTQIQTSLLHTNMEGKKKKNEKEQKRKSKPITIQSVKKSRFPIFSILITGFFGFSVWIAGFRLAGTRHWIIFLSFLIVVLVKLFAKYGPQAKQETSQGAIIAIISFIPGLRHIVPELSILPKKIAATIIGGAIAMLFVVQAARPATDRVPDSGLLPVEYLALGAEFQDKKSFKEARQAYEKALQLEPNGFAGIEALVKLRLLDDKTRKKEGKNTTETIKSDEDEWADEPTGVRKLKKSSEKPTDSKPKASNDDDGW